MKDSFHHRPNDASNMRYVVEGCLPEPQTQKDPAGRRTNAMEDGGGGGSLCCRAESLPQQGRNDDRKTNSGSFHRAEKGVFGA